MTKNKWKWRCTGQPPFLNVTRGLVRSVMIWILLPTDFRRWGRHGYRLLWHFWPDVYPECFITLLWRIKVTSTLQRVRVFKPTIGGMSAASHACFSLWRLVGKDIYGALLPLPGWSVELQLKVTGTTIKSGDVQINALLRLYIHVNKMSTRINVFTFSITVRKCLLWLTLSTIMAKHCSLLSGVSKLPFLHTSSSCFSILSLVPEMSYFNASAMDMG